MIAENIKEAIFFRIASLKIFLKQTDVYFFK